MRCPACYFNNRKGATECASCGVAMLAKDRKLQSYYDQSGSEKERAELIFTARYEQRRYRLMPQDTEETDASFYARIGREKTPHVLVEHAVVKDRLHRLQSAAKQMPVTEQPREPGSDDE
jgi:hypothetical protein